MLSDQLIRFTCDHWKQIAETAKSQILNDPEMPRMQELPQGEPELWAHRIIESLQVWSGGTEERSLVQSYRELGRARFVQGVPLPEVVRSLHVLKTATLDLVRSRGFAQTPVEIYAEEEVEYRLGKYFDRLVDHVVQGYWNAMQNGPAQRVGRAARIAG
jgi:hypothetical protein